MEEQLMAFAMMYIKCCIPGCGETAVALYPIYDIDQENPPKPYCQDHLDKMKAEFGNAIFLAMIEDDEKNGLRKW